MASILTNTSAMVALQNLRTINSNLVNTQNQIATGKKIATAKDNSTVWIVRSAGELTIMSGRWPCSASSVSTGARAASSALRGSRADAGRSAQMRSAVRSASE